MTGSERGVRRVRHELKLRLLQVSQVERITPGFVRVTLTGEDLAGYSSQGYDDHSKLFFPAPGEDKPRLPGGPDQPDGEKPVMRDYTPRRHDPVAGTLQFEIALHGEGPATEWAAQAKVGQYLGVGGPRGSFIVEGEFDWYLLVGDESALPAIARRLEELPADACAVAVIEVAGEAERQNLTAPANSQIRWVLRDQGENLLSALPGVSFPEGEAYGFVVGEGVVVKEIRRHLLDERGFNKKWLKASGYWRRGDAAVHENFED